MLPIVNQFFKPEEPEFNVLTEILERLGFNNSGQIIHLLFIELDRILKHGKVIDFVPKRDHMGDSLIWDTWEKWGDVVDKAAQISRLILDDRNNSDSQLKHANQTRTGRRAIDLLIFDDPSKPTDLTSSNIQGLKLIFLALLMLPSERRKRLDIEKIVAKQFYIGITLRDLFPHLPLNFKNQITFDALINECSSLVKIDYRESKKEQCFLRILRNTLIVLNGYVLGTRRGPSGIKGKISSVGTSRSKGLPKITRFTPFYKPDNTGDMVEISGEEGEEGHLGYIESENSDPKDDYAPEKVSSAEGQLRGRAWIQKYNEAVPWNSRGINPFTRRLLVAWIKKNDTVTSLLFALMLCTGQTIKVILALKVGLDEDFTIDGNYLKSYSAPDNSFTVKAELEPIMETVVQIIELPLPTLIKQRFCSPISVRQEKE